MLFMKLFFSLQIFLLLHTRSLVNAAAFDGARLVAAGAASPDEAEVRMRSLLGGLQVDVSWAGTTDTTVRVKVTARPSSPILAIPTLGAGVSRTASVRREGVPWISSA